MRSHQLPRACWLQQCCIKELVRHLVAHPCLGSPAAQLDPSSHPLVMQHPRMYTGCLSRTISSSSSRGMRCMSSSRMWMLKWRKGQAGGGSAGGWILRNTWQLLAWLQNVRALSSGDTTTQAIITFCCIVVPLYWSSPGWL